MQNLLQKKPTPPQKEPSSAAHAPITLIKKRAASRRQKLAAVTPTPLPMRAEVQEEKSTPPLLTSWLEHHHQHKTRQNLTSIFQPALFKRYLGHLPTLLLGLGSFACLTYVFLHVPPSEVMNWLIPQLYLPVTGLFFLGSFFSLSYLFLHSRRGLHWAVALTILLWLQLQQLLTGSILASILLTFAVIEAILTVSHQ